MNVDLINRIAATIRRVDGSNTMGAGALAEAIAEDLANLAVDEDAITRGVEGWAAEYGVAAHQETADMPRIVRAVLLGVFRDED